MRYRNGASSDSTKSGWLFLGGTQSTLEWLLCTLSFHKESVRNCRDEVKESVYRIRYCQVLLFLVLIILGTHSPRFYLDTSAYFLYGKRSVAVALQLLRKEAILGGEENLVSSPPKSNPLTFLSRV